jgi:hypothetical protein
VAGFGSESVAGFLLECMAGFVGIRIYYAFDLLHLDARDKAGLPLIERKACAFC